MASAGKKVVKIVKGLKKGAENVTRHPPYFKTYIWSGNAMPAPPLGPQLGQVCYTGFTISLGVCNL